MALYHNSQKKQPDKLVSAKALAKRFVERNGFIRHDLCRWDEYAWPVDMELICYGINFRMKYSCSPHRDFGMSRDAPADESVFQVFQAALDRFQEKMISQLAEIFGETPETFYQHSHVFEDSGEFDI